jgi:hypothetical protein
MFKYVFCCYVESDFGGDPFLTYIPLKEKSVEKGLQATLEDFQSKVGNYIPTRIEHYLHRLNKTSLDEDTMWVMAIDGPYAGILGMIEEVGSAGVGFLDIETGTTYLMPKKDVVEVPHWDFEEEVWAIDK